MAGQQETAGLAPTVGQENFSAKNFRLGAA